MGHLVPDRFSSFDAGAVLPRRRFSVSLVRLLPLSIATAAGLLFAPGAAAGDVVWVASLLLLGMPHGGYDLAALRRGVAGRSRRVAIASVYVGLMAACAVGTLLSPMGAMLCFLLLTAHHFGVSDAVMARERGPRGFGGHAVGLAHGLFVLGSVFAFDAAAAWAPFAEIAAWFGASEGAAASLPVGVAGAAAAVAGMSACVVALGTCVAWRRGRVSSRDAAEQGVLLGLFGVLAASADPMFAIAAYFVCVHAAGHCRRALHPWATRHERGVANAVRVHAESVLLVVLSLVIVALIAGFWADYSMHGIALSFLAFCVIATLPHHLFWLAGSVGLGRRFGDRAAGGSSRSVA